MGCLDVSPRGRRRSFPRSRHPRSARCTGRLRHNACRPIVRHFRNRSVWRGRPSHGRATRASAFATVERSPCRPVACPGATLGSRLRETDPAEPENRSASPDSRLEARRRERHPRWRNPPGVPPVRSESSPPRSLPTAQAALPARVIRSGSRASFVESRSWNPRALSSLAGKGRRPAPPPIGPLRPGRNEAPVVGAAGRCRRPVPRGSPTQAPGTRTPRRDGPQPFRKRDAGRARLRPPSRLFDRDGSFATESEPA